MLRQEDAYKNKTEGKLCFKIYIDGNSCPCILKSEFANVESFRETVYTDNIFRLKRVKRDIMKKIKDK